jgi:hypothetical protein
MNRPIAVTILAILAAIAGILAVIDVLRLLGILPIVALGPMNFFGVSIIGAIFAVIVAAIWFWAARGLWNLDPQAWLFVVSIAVIYLIFDVIALIGGTPIQSMLPSIVVSGLALILGLLPGTKESFGQST